MSMHRIAILLLLAATACTPPLQVRPLTEEEACLLPDHSAKDLPAVAAQLQEADGALRDLQGGFLARMESPRGSGTFEGAMVLRRSDALRIRGFRGAMSTFLDLLVTRDAGAVLHLPGEERAFLARPDQPLPLGEKRSALTAREFLDAIAGTLPDFKPGRDLLPEAGFWKLRDPKGFRRYDARTLFLLERVVHDAAGRPVFHVRYSEYRLCRDLWIAHRITIESETDSFSFHLALREPDVNDGTREQAFRLILPEGVERVEAGDR